MNSSHFNQESIAAENSFKFSRKQLLFKLLMQLTMAAGSIWALLLTEYLLALLVASAMVATMAPVWLRRRFHFYLPPETELLAIIFIYATLFLGEFGDFYNRFWWWDVLLHTGSSFLLGLVAFILVDVLNRAPHTELNLSPEFVALFAVVFALAVGTLWEIFEFTMDGLLGLNMQRSGLVDTMWDLIVDLVGATVVSIMGYAHLRNDHKTFIVPLMERFLRANKRLLRREPRS
ncbi:MAG: hypothetical protein ISR91_00990 [Candidatus Delongbacteria bacterium]|nr:hypothetical protein [Candidatus Delongbacteria bacterium]